MPRPRSTRLLLVLLVALLVTAPRARAATWELDATVSTEKETEIVNGKSDSTETFTQSYGVLYETDLTPVLHLALDFTLDVVDEINEPDYDTDEISPAVDAELQAVWWDLVWNWEMTQNKTADPAQNKTVDETWNVEFTAEPGEQVLPDTKIKFQRDRTQEGSEPQTRTDDIEASIDYLFWDLVEVTFDIAKEKQTNVDGLTVFPEGDPDTILEDIDLIQENRTYNLDVLVTKDLWDSLSLEAEWTNERDQTIEYADQTSAYNPGLDEPIYKDDVRSRDDTLNNNLRVLLTYVFLDDLELDLEREVDWQKDLEVGNLEVTDTWTGTATYSRSLTDTIDIDLSYDDERQDTRGTGSDSYKITRDYATALDFTPFDTFTFTPSWDRTTTKEWFDAPDQASVDDVDDTWELNFDGSFWYDQVEVQVTRTWNTVEESGTKTTDERNWDVDLSLAFEGVPNLELTPEYTYTEDKDLLKKTTDTEHQVDVGILYEINLNDVLSLLLDHTYTRISTDPAEGVSTIQREDDTEITLSWTDFFDGMEFEFSWTRQATDESEDDKDPEIDYTYSVLYAWNFLDNYDFSFEFQYDDNDISADTRNFLTTFSMELLDGLLTVDFEHELDQQLEEEKKDTWRYLIEVQVQF